MPHVSRGFRVALKRELAAWTEEGLVSSDTAGRLAGRYGLGDLATESRNQTAAAIFTIGSLLVGGGVIAFVSAHWERLAPWPKFVLLLAFLLALHGAGVMREERAYLFVGPSRSGKSTAVRLSAPAISMGDDFAVVLPRPKEKIPA